MVHLAAVGATVFIAGLPRGNWPRTIREVFARQLLFTGVEAIGFVTLVAALVGIVVVEEGFRWLDHVGLAQQVGPLLVALVARDLAPLLVNIVVIVRSGSTIASELGQMRVTGEVRTLEAQGIDPFLYLVMPRVLSMIVAAIGLTICFMAIAFIVGYGFGVYTGVVSDSPQSFLEGVFQSVSLADGPIILLKTTLPAFATGVICCVRGLDVGESQTAIPVAVFQSLSHSLAVLFIIFAVIIALFP